jgi:hypothetical protein
MCRTGLDDCTYELIALAQIDAAHTEGYPVLIKIGFATAAGGLTLPSLQAMRPSPCIVSSTKSSDSSCFSELI